MGSAALPRRRQGDTTVEKHKEHVALRLNPHVSHVARNPFNFITTVKQRTSYFKSCQQEQSSDVGGCHYFRGASSTQRCGDGGENSTPSLPEPTWSNAHKRRRPKESHSTAAGPKESHSTAVPQRSFTLHCYSGGVSLHAINLRSNTPRS